MDDPRDNHPETGGGAERLRGRISELEAALVELKLQIEALRRNEDKYEALINCLDDAVFVLGMDGIFNRFYRKPGRGDFFLPTRELLGKHLRDILPEDVAGLFLRALNAVEAYGRPQSFDFVFKEKILNARLSPYRSEKGDYFGYLCVLRDVTENKRMEESLRENEARYRAVMEQSQECILLADIDSRMILESNGAMQRLLGYTRDELPGMSLYDLMARAQDDIYQEILKVIEERSYFKGERKYRRKDGSIVSVEMGVNVLRFFDKKVLCVVSRDITPRKLAERQLAYTATHDPLTGLVNRLLLYDRLAQQLASARRREAKFALLYIDLDRFKLVNDTLGHNVGDHLLKAVGLRLRSALRRETDTLARMGGDEYMIILADLQRDEEAEAIARNVMEAIRKPYDLEGLRHHISASIGISVFPIDGKTSDDLIKAADLAMYTAKKLGRDRFCRYTPDMKSRSAAR
jgi:diguanylate cyclase (GGDEF)-like protein/PAS domain S-box-containing protein